MISVCLASFNGEKYIQEQLESILKQIGSNDEVIVVDDCSTDNTRKRVISFRDNRIKLFENKVRLGSVFNFEQALQYASGDYLFLSDQDDIWLDGKVEKVMNALRNSDLVLHNAKFLLEEGSKSLFKSTLFEWRIVRRGVFCNLYRNSYTGCCMAFKRKVLECALPFPKRIAMHDWWIGVIAEQFFRIQILKQPLMEYRRHTDNVTQLVSMESNLSWKIFTSRFWCLYHLLIHVLKCKC